MTLRLHAPRVVVAAVALCVFATVSAKWITRQITVSGPTLPVALQLTDARAGQRLGRRIHQPVSL